MRWHLTFVACLCWLLWCASAFPQTNFIGAGFHGDVKVAGGGSFTPASLPGLQLWLKADAGVTQSGGTVSSWTDQSSNAYSLAPGYVSPSSAPTYSSTGFNSSHPGVAFSGPSGSPGPANVGVDPSTLNSTTMSLFVVHTATAYNANSSRLFSISVGGCDTCSNGFAFGLGSSSYYVYQNSSFVFSSVTGSLNTPQTFGVTFDGSNATVYMNEVSKGSALWNQTIGSSSTPIAFMLGVEQNGPGSVTFTGTIAEVVMTTTPVSPTNLANLSTYFSSKWGCSC
jgi:hypothetical protein